MLCSSVRRSVRRNNKKTKYELIRRLSRCSLCENCVYSTDLRTAASVYTLFSSRCFCFSLYLDTNANHVLSTTNPTTKHAPMMSFICFRCVHSSTLYNSTQWWIVRWGLTHSHTTRSHSNTQTHTVVCMWIVEHIILSTQIGMEFVWKEWRRRMCVWLGTRFLLSLFYCSLIVRIDSKDRVPVYRNAICIKYAFVGCQSIAHGFRAEWLTTLY